jgi:hypothetical protein
MSDSDPLWFRILRWAWPAIFVPVFVWVKRIWCNFRIKKRRRESLISALEGLPHESKAKLVQFHEKGSQTLRLIDGSQELVLLVRDGFLERRVGGGAYDAVDAYYTVSPDIWKVMDDWITRERIRFSRKQMP